MIRFCLYIIFIFGCNNTSPKVQDNFTNYYDIYAEAFKKHYGNDNIEKIYIALDFPDFKMFEGDFFFEVFDYTSFKNNNNFIEEIPNKDKFIHTFNSKFKNRNIEYIYFNKFVNDTMLLKENKNPIFVFSPIYFDSLQGFGFVLISRFNNYKNYNSSVTYFQKKIRFILILNILPYMVLFHWKISIILNH